MELAGKTVAACYNGACLALGVISTCSGRAGIDVYQQSTMPMRRLNGRSVEYEEEQQQREHTGERPVRELKTVCNASVHYFAAD
jgi:hypothetical protein